MLNKVTSAGYRPWSVNASQSIFGKTFGPFGLKEGTWPQGRNEFHGMIPWGFSDGWFNTGRNPFATRQNGRRHRGHQQPSLAALPPLPEDASRLPSPPYPGGRAAVADGQDADVRLIPAFHALQAGSDRLR